MHKQIGVKTRIKTDCNWLFLNKHHTCRLSTSYPTDQGSNIKCFTSDLATLNEEAIAHNLPHVIFILLKINLTSTHGCSFRIENVSRKDWRMKLHQRCKQLWYLFWQEIEAFRRNLFWRSALYWYHPVEPHRDIGSHVNRHVENIYNRLDKTRYPN